MVCLYFFLRRGKRIKPNYILFLAILSINTRGLGVSRGDSRTVWCNNKPIVRKAAPPHKHVWTGRTPPDCGPKQSLNSGLKIKSTSMIWDVFCLPGHVCHIMSHALTCLLKTAGQLLLSLDADATTLCLRHSWFHAASVCARMNETTIN